MMNGKTKVGYIQGKVLHLCSSDKLTLALNQPIFISEGNVEHIKNEHPVEYEMYFSELNNILSNPDYVGFHPNGRSLEYIKFFGDGPERVLVAIRATQRGTLFVKTLFSINEEKFNSYIKSGTIQEVK